MTSPDVAAVVVAELRACPFCGSPAATPHENDWCEPPMWSVHCAGADCFAMVRESLTKEDAIEKWNRRTLLDSLDRQGDVVVAPPAPATLISIARRWVALVGGSWYLDRHAADKAQLIADTRAAIAEAEGLDDGRGTGASPPSEPVPVLLSHIEQGRSDRVAKLEEALLYSRQLISMVEKHGTPAGFSLDASSTLKMIDAALSTQGEK